MILNGAGALVIILVPYNTIFGDAGGNAVSAVLPSIHLFLSGHSC